MMKKRLFAIVLIFLISFVFASCKQLDVIGQTSITSFQDVLNTIPDKITSDDTYGGWSLTAPDSSARFIWNKDYSKGPLYDVMIEFDAKPFITAGLDIEKLPENMHSNNKIIVGTKLGIENSTDKNEITPLSSYEQVVSSSRQSIKYHAALDHFGIDLSNGNTFEWAKDVKKNDKDIVFVLDPKIFIDAGVNPEKVEGWVFSKIKTMDTNGKSIEVEKFLKPFNLK